MDYNKVCALLQADEEPESGIISCPEPVSAGLCSVFCLCLLIKSCIETKLH